MMSVGSVKLVGAIGVAVAVLLAPPTESAAQTPVEEAMDLLAPYVGVWESDERQANDGRAFQFVYDVQWYGESEQLVEILITQRFTDGESSILWKGFKGWSPADGGLFYYGFSPMGRVGRGIVEQRGSELVTEYQGWGPRGPVVEVRDVFEPITEGQFLARTYVRPTPEDEWAEVSRDRWTRTEDRGVSDPLSRDAAPAQESEALAPRMADLEWLLGRWSGHATVGDVDLRSAWAWTPSARGFAILASTTESFNGEPFEANMVELITWDADAEALTFLTANGRGAFTMRGTLTSTPVGLERRWTLATADGRQIQGRDILVREGRDRIRWEQEMDDGTGWRSAPYSPFFLERAG